MAEITSTVEAPIEEITRRIVEALHPRRVILFGSRATGRAQADSDVDVMVEMETLLPPLERMRAVSRLFPRRRWAMDVVVFTPDEVREQRAFRNSLIRTIEAEGRVLYEQP